MRAADVVVLGSANLDLVLSVPSIPRAGETVLAGELRRNPGGKGLNQAVAAARCGARTAFLGAVGDDPEGALLVAALEHAGVDVTAVRRTHDDTGTAVVVVDGAGENSIVVAPGANSSMTALRVAESAAIGGAAVLLAQLEIPVGAVLQGAAEARRAGARTILNAAPARALPDELWSLLDVLVVNEDEALSMAAQPGTDQPGTDPPGTDQPGTDVVLAAAALAGRVPLVVVTLGAQGALVADRDGSAQRIGAPAAEVVDTTGAGDTFCGVLAAALAEGAPVQDAVRLANAAASLSVERHGAVPSIPDRAESEARRTSSPPVSSASGRKPPP